MKVNSIYNASIECAREAKNALDKRIIYNPHKAGDLYGTYLKNKAQCPTRAKIAMQEVEMKDGIKYPDLYKFYQTAVEARKDLGKYVFEIIEKEKLQKKTSPYRNYLISNNMIKMDTVTPKKSKFDKLLYKFHNLFT